MSSAPNLPKYRAPSGGMDRFIQTDPWDIQNSSITMDNSSYNTSDVDFAKRYPSLAGAQQTYRDYANQAMGDATENQARQNTMTNLGIDQLYNRFTQNPSSPVSQQVMDAGGQLLVGKGTGGGTDWASNENSLSAEGNKMLSGNKNLQDLESQAGQRLNAAPDAAYAGVKQKGAQILSGNQPIDPLVQQELARSGMGKAAQSLGVANLGKGDAGASAAARNLGLGVMDYSTARQNQGLNLLNQGQAGLNTQRQEAVGEVGTSQQLNLSQRQMAMNFLNQSEQMGLSRTQAAAALMAEGQQLGEQYQQDNSSLLSGMDNMVNANRALATGDITNASQMFAPRQFGIGGQGAAQIQLNNIAGLNNWNQANWASRVQESAYAANQGAQQAGLNSQASNQNMQMGAAAASIAATAASACGIARAVYGEHSPKWKRFRAWLLHRAPWAIRRLYLNSIPYLAPVARKHEPVRRALQALMDPVVNNPSNVPFPIQG